MRRPLLRTPSFFKDDIADFFIDSGLSSSSCKFCLSFVPFTMSTTTVLRKDTLYSRRQVEGLIADGRTIIIVDQKVLKVDAWLKFHPGGDKAIMHMVGRDATDELNA